MPNMDVIFIDFENNNCPHNVKYQMSVMHTGELDFI